MHKLISQIHLNPAEHAQSAKKSTDARLLVHTYSHVWANLLAWIPVRLKRKLSIFPCALWQHCCGRRRKRWKTMESTSICQAWYGCEVLTVLRLTFFLASQTQGIWRRGKKRAYLAQPKADWEQIGANRSSLGPSLGVTCSELRAVGSNLRPTWAQLGSNMGLACVGASGPNTSPMGNWLRTNPTKAQKTLEIAIEMQIFSVSESAKLARIGPILARLPSKGPCLSQTCAQVALSWAQLEPKLAPTDHVGLSWAQSDLDGFQLEATPCTWKSTSVPRTWHLWRQLHTKLRPTETQHGEPCFKPSVIDRKKTRKIPVKTGVLKISAWAGYVAQLYGSYGPQLGPKLLPNRPIGAKVRHLGAKLGRNWSQVGPIWAKVGAVLAEVDPKSGRYGPVLRPCWTETVHLDDFGPICKMCKLHQITTIPCTFLQSFQKWAEAVPVWQICPVVSLAAKLPRLGTFGAI